jgi:small subunit ribosomal protein S21
VVAVVVAAISRWSWVRLFSFASTADRNPQGETMSLKMRVHDREPIGAALRRFKKLLERSGLTKELRKRKHYQKPCEIRRRAEERKKTTIRKAKTKVPSRSSYW